MPSDATSEVETKEEPEEPIEETSEAMLEKPSEKPVPWYCIEHGAVIPKESSGRMFCPICNKLVSKESYEKKLEGVGVEAPKPAEVEMMEATLRV